MVMVMLASESAIPDAIRKGVEAARKSLIHVPMVGTTIPHEVLVRQNAAQILLKPASTGTGLVAGGSCRAILEAAGVKDVLAKSLGSSNKVNTAWATIEALRRLKRASEVARLRGKNVNELVSKSVAQATLLADQEDALAEGIVLSDEPAIIAVEATPIPEPVVEAIAALAAEEVSNGS